MREVRQDYFYKNIKELLGMKGDSPVAVLLCSDKQKGGEIPEKLYSSLSRLCPVEMFCQAPAQTEQQICERSPDVILAVGEFFFLQEVCRLRQDLAERDGKRQIPLVLFTSEDAARMLFKELLWERDPAGNTIALRHLSWGENDLFVLPKENKKRKEFAGELKRWERGMSEVLIRPSGEIVQEEWTQRRLVWEEMAHPLWLRYGVPLWLGFYHSFLFLVENMYPAERESLNDVLGFPPGERADWRLEERAVRCMGEEVRGLWIPRADVPLLTEMAMAGIEMLPEQILSRQQVQRFYESLCR